MKKILSVLAIVIALAAVLSLAVFALTPTDDNWYEISTADGKLY